MAEMKFSGLVNTYINPSLVGEPIPGVKIYDGLNLSEFDPEITIEHNDTEPIATSLGMSLKHFHSILNGEENKKDIPAAPKKSVVEERPFPVKNDTVPEPDYGSFAEAQETEKVPETK